jgi:hypothetical protein
MGLDQYLYGVEAHTDNTDFDVSSEAASLGICTWRKHPNLQGWMEKLFNIKADAQGYKGYTNFPDSVISKVVGEIDKDKVTPELIEKAVMEDQMQQLILEQQYISATASFNKKRMFNNQYLRLNMGDLDQLEMAVKLGELPPTIGFFFGDDSSDEYKEQDLAVIEIARNAIRYGVDVYYNSSW